MHQHTFSLKSLLWIIVAFWLSNAAIAHQQKYATTTVSLNARNGNLEIVHRFLVHDAEHVVKHLFSSDADFNNQPETQKNFANYVVDHFNIKLNDQASVLDVIGFESDEKFFWVYQEVVKPEHITQIQIRQTALHETWPRQVNLVNIEGFGGVNSMEFRKGDQWKTLDL